jgi:hypothetical protein
VEPDRPQQERHAACVIAQQYSSTTFDSLRSHSLKQKSGAVFVTIITSFSLLS